MVVLDKKNIILGNLENKVVYYDTDENKFTFTYFNNDNKVSKKIAIYSVIVYLLLKLLSDTVVFNNAIIKIAILIICYIVSVKIAKILFEIDNPKQEKKDLYQYEEVIKELLISWRNKTIIAMFILAIDIALIIATIYYFFTSGNIYSLFFFSATIMFFEVANIDVIKRFKLLNKLIKEYE